MTETTRVSKSHPDQTESDRATVWSFLWVLFVFKIATVGATAWAAGWSSEAGYILSITTWPWLIIPALAFSGSFLYQWRVRRVRRRRAALQLSEWMIEGAPPSGHAVSGLAIGSIREKRQHGD
ncbi:MAG: hypothetical protein AB7V46_22140 [Thermomicrobiales bacterium]